MNVVCNSSVLIALSTIDQLRLLRERFKGKKMVIPHAVLREVVEEGRDQPGAKEVETADWITVRAARDQAKVRLLEAELDRGEAEAIALAHEIKAEVILLDEKDARQVAKRIGLRTLGTIGILIWARRGGLIGNLREQLDILQEKGKFRISPELRRQVLREAGEDDGGGGRSKR